MLYEENLYECLKNYLRINSLLVYSTRIFELTKNIDRYADMHYRKRYRTLICIAEVKFAQWLATIIT